MYSLYRVSLQVEYTEQDVAVITAFRNFCLSWANLPASVTVMFRWSLMACVHLLLGQPRALLPGTIPSIMVFSKLSWPLIWPKYCSFLLSRWQLKNFWTLILEHIL